MIEGDILLLFIKYISGKGLFHAKCKLPDKQERMKRLFSLSISFLLVYLTSSAQPGVEKPFRVSGNIMGIDNAQWVFLSYMSDGERKTDSIELKNGSYEFTGSLVEPVAGRMTLMFKADTAGKKMPTVYKRDQFLVFLEPSAVIKIENTDSFSNAKIKGSRAHESYLGLQQTLKPLTEQSEQLSAQYSALYKAKDTAAMKKLEPRFEELDSSMKLVYADYVKKNPRSPIVMYALSQVAGWDVDPDKVEPLMKLLPVATRNLPSAKLLQEKIETARKTGIGRMAMDFTQNDTLGNPVSLSSFRGKYVLIDFWASWCGPCRAENPNVVEAFRKYTDKGFTVLGVSLDRPNAKDKWIKAIHDDQLTWTHVSDLQFWKNAVAVQYGIQAIPQNILVDREGKIIGKNLRGEALQKKLDELFR